MSPDDLASLAICLFGPPQVRVGGVSLPSLRSRKGIWLLALLTLRAGRDVERSWLASTLWPESAEAAASANFRNTLSDLRRALGHEAVRLCAPSPRTLRLDLSGAYVDLLAFDEAITQGSTAKRSEVVDAALKQAVALYRGPLLEGCAEGWAFEERQVREQAYLTALETLAAHAMAADNPAAAERYLRRAAAADPLRETTQRALMDALAAGGNVAAALQVYRDLRLSLRREMQAEPDPATTAFYRSLCTARDEGESTTEAQTGSRAVGSPGTAGPPIPDLLLLFLRGSLSPW